MPAAQRRLTAAPEPVTRKPTPPELVDLDNPQVGQTLTGHEAFPRTGYTSLAAGGRSFTVDPESGVILAEL